MLSATTLLTIYICVTNPLIPITIYKIGKFTIKILTNSNKQTNVENNNCSGNTLHDKS